MNVPVMLGKSKAIDANQPIPIAGVARWTFSGMRVSSISPKALATWASVRDATIKSVDVKEMCMDVFISSRFHSGSSDIKINLFISKNDWLEWQMVINHLPLNPEKNTASKRSCCF